MAETCALCSNQAMYDNQCVECGKRCCDECYDFDLQLCTECLAQVEE